MCHAKSNSWLHGKLLFSPSCLKKGYTCASVVDHKTGLQVEMDVQAMKSFAMLATTAAEVF